MNVKPENRAPGAELSDNVTRRVWFLCLFFGSSESCTKTRLSSTVLSNAGGAGTGEGGRSGLSESGEGEGGGSGGKSLDVILRRLWGSWRFDPFPTGWWRIVSMGVSSTCMSSLDSEHSILTCELAGA